MDADKRNVCPNPSECARDIQRNADCINIVKDRLNTMLPSMSFYRTIGIVVTLVCLVLAAMGNAVRNLHDDIENHYIVAGVDIKDVESELRFLRNRLDVIVGEMRRTNTRTLERTANIAEAIRETIDAMKENDKDMFARIVTLESRANINVRNNAQAFIRMNRAMDALAKSVEDIKQLLYEQNRIANDKK